MKIVVFAPHPDDEIMGCGGSILKWIEEGHEVHIIYLTDNRALFAEGHVNDQIIQKEAEPYINLTEDQIAEIGLKEAYQAAKAFGLEYKRIHLFKFHDLDLMNQIDKATDLSINIIKDADTIIVSSNNNTHPDHQAANTIVKIAAQKLKLTNTEFYVYAVYVPSKPSKEKLVKINIVGYRDRVYDIMKIYKTQLALVDTRAGWEYLKRKRYERFGLFNLTDCDKYFNF